VKGKEKNLLKKKRGSKHKKTYLLTWGNEKGGASAVGIETPRAGRGRGNTVLRKIRRNLFVQKKEKKGRFLSEKRRGVKKKRQSSDAPKRPWEREEDRRSG